jgi:hypothetical protein
MPSSLSILLDMHLGIELLDLMTMFNLCKNGLTVFQREFSVLRSCQQCIHQASNLSTS